MSKYVCKYCGQSGDSPSSVCSGTCSKSPTKHHEIISGQSNYVCKYCGQSHPSPSSLLSGSCSKSPHKHHELVG